MVLSALIGNYHERAAGGFDDLLGEDGQLIASDPASGSTKRDASLGVRSMRSCIACMISS